MNLEGGLTGLPVPQSPKCYKEARALGLLFCGLKASQCHNQRSS